jgi:D-alanine-D-alanine ligase
MRIGITYDTFDHFEWSDDHPPDADAEFEPMETVAVLEEALHQLGHETRRWGGPKTVAARLAQNERVDVVVNIAEGQGSRNREGFVPTLLDLYRIPFIGSDALCLSLTLDKVLTKNVLRGSGSGIRCTPSWVISPKQTQLPEDLVYPVFAKPRYEGSSMGISEKSRITSEEDLRAHVQTLAGRYKQDILIEPFLAGAEYTVGVFGHPPVASLALQRALEETTRIGLHALERRGRPEKAYAYAIPGPIDVDIEAEMQRMAVDAFEMLSCRDFARIDFKCDDQGEPYFLEINPLPTFAPDGTFAILAELSGQSYADFLSGILDQALRRVTSP